MLNQQGGAVPSGFQLGFGPQARGTIYFTLDGTDPRLPGFVNWVELRGLRVGQARASLRFARSGDGVKVDTLDVQGELKVDVEGAPR